MLHRSNRGTVGSDFVASPTQPGRCHGCVLGHAHDLQRQNAVERGRTLGDAHLFVHGGFPLFPQVSGSILIIWGALAI